MQKMNKKTLFLTENRRYLAYFREFYLLFVTCIRKEQKISRLNGQLNEQKATNV